MQRVLHVLNNLGSGGAESFLMNMYRNIDRSKVQFDFLIRSDKNGPYVDEIQSMGGRVIQMAAFPRHALKNYRELKQFFKEHHKEYSAVHVHANSLLYIKPLQLAKKYNIPCRVIHSHNTNSKLAKGIHLMNRNRIHSYVTDQFACSDAAGEWMFGNNEFRVIANGIDLKKFSFSEDKRKAIRRQYDVEDKLVIGHIGRFSYQKNHPFLIKIFHRFVQSHPNSVLMLIGDGEGRKAVEETVASLGIKDKVIFVGAVSNVHEYLFAMDRLLFPSFFEGFPVALIEAQATGIPCVLSDSIPLSIIFHTNCKACSLSDDISVWIEALENNDERVTPSCEIGNYDAGVVAKGLENFYLSAAQKG